MSLSGDKTGIAGTWITGKQPPALIDPSMAEQKEQLELNKELQYKLAFSVSVEAPKGFQVSFAKTRNFIRWLRDKGFAIKGISMDTYQSANMAQDLKADGFKTEIVSVDRVDQQHRVCLPYHALKTAIYEQRVKIYQKCDLLTEELVNLERLTNGKIDHPANGSKDQADAFCGSLYLASSYAEEYAKDYGEDLDAGLTVSLETSEASLRSQMIAEFENELARVYLETYEEVLQVDPVYDRQKKEEYEHYRNISDGIIVI